MLAGRRGRIDPNLSPTGFQYGFIRRVRCCGRAVKGREWYQADAIAEEYEDKRFSGGGRLIDRREREAVLLALEPIQGKDILEIACGTGRFTVMVAERGGTVLGIDISEAMLVQGRVKARSANVTDTLAFIRGDASRLPFPDNHFDATFAIRFFHLADDPIRFLREMRRVTANHVFFDTFNAPSARSVYNWLLPMGSRLYSREDVMALLDGSDLLLVDETHDFVIPYGVYRSIPDWLASPLRRVDTRVLGSPGGTRCASVSFWQAKPRPTDE